MGRGIALAVVRDDTALCIAIVGSQKPVAGTHLLEIVMPDGLAGVLLGAEPAVLCFTERPGENTTVTGLETNGSMDRHI